MQTVSLNRQKTNDMRGFSLVEIIIVMLIMSVVMMAVMSLVVPTQRSSVIQSDLSTIQGGMRVALERMTKDFRNAGFLFNGDAIAGYVVDTPVTPTVLNPLTINTLQVSGVFGRIDTVPITPSGSFSLIYPDQFRNFPAGSYAAVVNPLTGLAIGDVYYVMNSSSGSVKLGDKVTENELTLTQVNNFSTTEAGLVLLRVPSSRIPYVISGTMTVAEALNRTIRYYLEDGTLIRHVDYLIMPDGTEDGFDQKLASGISELTFIVEEDGDGDVNKVTIDLVGEAEAIGAGNDAVSSAKTKRVRILIALRNV